jgi:NAD(P)H-nitrite reductase large subunit
MATCRLIDELTRRAGNDRYDITVRPRVELASASGLPVNRGILVNDALATETPRVYAPGECAEHTGKTYGIVAPVWEQAAVLADVLSGAAASSRYQGSKLYARLKVAGIDVASGVRQRRAREDGLQLPQSERRRDSASRVRGRAIGRRRGSGDARRNRLRVAPHRDRAPRAAGALRPIRSRRCGLPRELRKT